MSYELHLSTEIRELIEEQLRAGGYSSAEEVIRAGLERLRQGDAWGDFDEGEIDALIEEGERSAADGPTISADELLAELRGSKQRRSNS